MGEVKQDRLFRLHIGGSSKRIRKDIILPCVKIETRNPIYESPNKKVKKKGYKRMSSFFVERWEMHAKRKLHIGNRIRRSKAEIKTKRQH